MCIFYTNKININKENYLKFFGKSYILYDKNTIITLTASFTVLYNNGFYVPFVKLD